VISKPDWYEVDPSLGGLVASWGYEITASERFGSWQGDEVYILSDGDRFGISVIGYGSCSGCDAFEAATPFPDDDSADWSEMVSLCYDLRNQIRWFDSPVEAVVALDLSSNSLYDWWIHDRAVVRWLLANIPGREGER
jgi:hypothetical protein